MGFIIGWQRTSRFIGIASFLPHGKKKPETGNKAIFCQVNMRGEMIGYGEGIGETERNLFLANTYSFQFHNFFSKCIIINFYIK